jgi:uncharacterized protein YqeY
MLRAEIGDAMKNAMRAKDQVALATVRMMNAAIKDRDIAVRPEGRADGITDGEIVELLRKLIKQRQESVVLYKQGNRPELVAREEAEIAVIERFLPQSLEGAALEEAVAGAIAHVGAGGIKDMGKVVARLREAHPGQVDIAKASAIAKAKLSA